MGKIPTKLTEEQFNKYVDPHLSKAKRGFISTIPLFKIFNYILYFLHTGCQWEELPIEQIPVDPKIPDGAKQAEISYHAIYHHFRKWSNDGSLERVWQHSIKLIEDHLDLSEINLDGSHAPAKKGGEAVAYQGRKKQKPAISYQ